MQRRKVPLFAYSHETEAAIHALKHVACSAVSLVQFLEHQQLPHSRKSARLTARAQSELQRASRWLKRGRAK